jgi:hypothetical protein
LTAIEKQISCCRRGVPMELGRTFTFKTVCSRAH